MILLILPFDLLPANTGLLGMGEGEKAVLPPAPSPQIHSETLFSELNGWKYYWNIRHWIYKST